MLRSVIILSIFFAGLTALEFEEKHFKTIPLSEDIPCPARDDEGDERHRATVQTHWNRTVIPDDDGGNFGDLEVYPGRNVGQQLYFRDTIINDISDHDVVLCYAFQVSQEFVVRDVKFLNFGRQRGYVTYVFFTPPYGYVGGEVLIHAGEAVRISVEIYVDPR